MTTISVFCTFTNNNFETNLLYENLDNIYMISDSKLTTKVGNGYVFHSTDQKIFYSNSASLIFGISGEYNIGKKVIKRCIEEIEKTHGNFKFNSMDEKLQYISNVVKTCVDRFHINNFAYDTTIVCITSFKEKYNVTKYTISKLDKTIFTRDCCVMEKTSVTSEGYDGKSFENFLNEKSLATPFYIPKSTIHFTNFIEFLYSENSQSSGPPCQGVVMNKYGKIKELSIKHKDGNFYKMGKIHNNREIRKYEIDYRDMEFSFLTRSKIK